MRTYVLIGCAVACLLGLPSPAPAGSFNTLGLFVGTVSLQIAALLSQFPAGGPGLRGAIARMVEADPSLADDAAFAARGANPSQKEAIGAGLADAANFFARIASGAARDAGRRIATALSSADPGTQAGSLLSSVLTQVGGIPGVGNAGAATSNCISPSRPGC
jgi:hypothetical protein